MSPYIKILFHLDSLFNSKSTFLAYLIPKPSLKKNCGGSNLTHSWERDKGFPTFPKNVSLKVNVRVLLEIELAIYDVTVQHLSHYTAKALSLLRRIKCRVSLDAL